MPTTDFSTDFDCVVVNDTFLGLVSRGAMDGSGVRGVIDVFDEVLTVDIIGARVIVVVGAVAVGFSEGSLAENRI